MAGHRADRVREDILRELTAIIRKLKDPRVNQGLISVVRVELTNDFSHATVYISSFGGLQDAAEAVKGLSNASGYIRRELGSALRLRAVPELRFVPDDSIAYSAKIADTLRSLHLDESAPKEEPHERDADAGSDGR